MFRDLERVRHEIAAVAQAALEAEAGKARVEQPVAERPAAESSSEEQPERT